DAIAFYNRGNALAKLDRNEAAVASYDAALRIKPNYAEALYNRGNLLRITSRPLEAITSYERALALRSDHPYAFGNMADCELGLCNWEKLPGLVSELNARIQARASIISPFVSLAFSDDPEIQFECATAFVRDQVKGVAALPPCGPALHTTEKLRIGYMS